MSEWDTDPVLRLFKDLRIEERDDIARLVVKTNDENRENNQMRIEASAYAGPKKEFAVASEGIHRATLAKIVDKGMVYNKWKEKDVHEAVLIWETEEWDEENERPVTVAQKVSVTLFKNKKTGKASVLREVAEALLKRELTPAEEASFEVDDLIGKTAQLIVEHKTLDDGRIWTKVAKVTKDVEKKPAAKKSSKSAPADDDDAVPF